MSISEMDEKIQKNLFAYLIIAFEFVALKFHYHDALLLMEIFG